MESLLSRAVATPEDVQRLGQLGAFDWTAAKLRDAVQHLDPACGFTVELRRIAPANEPEN